MACRRILNLLLRRNRPILFGVASSFVQYDPLKTPNPDEKLNLEPPDMKYLSFDYLIKQSTIESVNSATQTLTVTYIAIETSSKEYRDSLVKLISLLQESQMREVGGAHWDAIIILRSKVQEKKEEVTRLIGYMEYVQKMAVAAAQVCFLSGMDNLSTTLSQRMDDAINNTQKEMTQNQILEEELTRVEQDCILQKKEPANLDNPPTEISIDIP